MRLYLPGLTSYLRPYFSCHPHFRTSPVLVTTRIFPRNGMHLLSDTVALRKLSPVKNKSPVEGR